MKVKELKENLKTYNDNDDVLVFVGRSGRDREIIKVMPIVSNNDDEKIIGVAIECEN